MLFFCIFGPNTSAKNTQNAFGYKKTFIVLKQNFYFVNVIPTHLQQKT